MSQPFGYGSTYNTSWRNTSAPGQGTAGGIMPADMGPNFNPAATSPWADPTIRQVGSEYRHLNENGLIQNDRGATNPMWRRDPWANPLDALYGDPVGPGQGPMASGGKYAMPSNPLIAPANQHQPGYTTTVGGLTIQMDPNKMPQGQYGTEHMGSGHQYDFSQEMQSDKYGNQAYRSGPMPPRNTKELFDSIGGLSMDQLMRMSSFGGVTQRFQDVAQSYKNAFANPNYGKRQFGHGSSAWQVGGPGGLNEKDTMDYLQQSYDKLATRMNDNYLL